MLLYYILDPHSLSRFADHAFGSKTGLGVIIPSDSKPSFVSILRRDIAGQGAVPTIIRLPAFISSLGFTSWAAIRRKEMRDVNWLLIATAVGSICCTVLLFPNQPYYLAFLTFLTPVALLIAGRESGLLVRAGLAMLFFAVAVNSLFLSLGILQRIEQLPSFRMASQQPSHLLARLHWADAIVGINGDSYDLFKPVLRHLVTLQEKDVDDYTGLSGIANCYDDYDGLSGVVRPLPQKIDPRAFHMIEPSPKHLWITLFGRRVRHAERGYGCDLYVRNLP
jgi:hypothetical protein